MIDPVRQRFANWQMEELLAKYVDLRLSPAPKGESRITGRLGFSAETPGHRRVVDEYDIQIFLASNYPKAIPLVREVGGRIPKTFHKLEADYLCLGSPTRLRLILVKSPSILNFVEQCVIPYLYSYSIFEHGGSLPFGELSHGPLGLREDFASLLGIDNDNDDAVLGFVKLLSMGKRQANKLPCACGSHLRLGRCHHRRLNALRNSLGRRWFASLLSSPDARFGRNFPSRRQTTSLTLARFAN